MHVIVGAVVVLTILTWALLRGQARRERELPVVPPAQRAEDDALRAAASPDVPSIAGRWRP